MGNESSLLKECQIDETPVWKRGNEYSLHHATRVDDNLHFSVFLSLEDGDDSKNLLHLMIKNLKLYRHPYIVKYVSHCEVNNAAYLFTEKVSPLTLVLKQQSYLQICLGLQNIIQAVMFLHGAGRSCHNNICQSAVFVTPEGRWKLGGMEFVTKFDAVSQSFLESTHSHRYEKGISPEERSAIAFKDHSKRDIYSLGVLIDEVLSCFMTEAKNLDSVVEKEVAVFAEYAKHHLQSSESDLRPSLKELLSHSYFHHDYLRIVAFLTDLPLKSYSEKKEFFTNLTEKLFLLPEKVVSGQLAPLLLSRLVLLDDTAQKLFIPNMLTPAPGQRGSFSSNMVLNPILSEIHFQDGVIPILKKIFHVRDIQIRTVLLRHFSSYCHLFHQVQLEEEIMPQLLLGIRDNHDKLVADSLRALADVVPLLGAEKVIGKNRRKIFADGLPGKRIHENSVFSMKKSGMVSMRNKESSLSREQSVSPDLDRNLSHRHSPIGAEMTEDQSDQPSIEQTSFDENKFDQKSFDEWEDWEQDDPDVDAEGEPVVEDQVPEEIQRQQLSTEKPKVPLSTTKVVDVKTVADLKDVTYFDIKVSTTNVEEDFFADMTPIISETPVATISSNKVEKNSKFDVDVDLTDHLDGDGWGDDEDWN